MNDKSYNDWYAMTDKALSETIGHYIQRERVGQNRSQTEVAKSAGISRSNTQFARTWAKCVNLKFYSGFANA